MGDSNNKVVVVVIDDDANDDVVHKSIDPTKIQHSYDDDVRLRNRDNNHKKKKKNDMASLIIICLYFVVSIGMDLAVRQYYNNDNYYNNNYYNHNNNKEFHSPAAAVTTWLFVWVGLGVFLLVHLSNHHHSTRIIWCVIMTLCFMWLCGCLTQLSTSSSSSIMSWLLPGAQQQHSFLLVLLQDCALAIVLFLQVCIVVLTLRSFPRRTQTMGQTVLYGVIGILHVYFMLLSMIYIVKCISVWPISETTTKLATLCDAEASYLFFAYATWLGSKLHHREDNNNEDDDDGCDDINNKGQDMMVVLDDNLHQPQQQRQKEEEGGKYWMSALIAIGLHVPTAISLATFSLSSSSLSTFFSSSYWESTTTDPGATNVLVLSSSFSSFLLDATLFCFASAMFWQVILDS